MIASLGMYDMPFTFAANDTFWRRIRMGLGEGPETLDRVTPLWEIWQSPELLFAQTCSLPFRKVLAGDVTLVGTPDYGLPGCKPGYYRSVLVTRISGPEMLSDLAGAPLAISDKQSQSGWAAPLLHLDLKGVVPGPLVETGAHRASALAVLEKRADFAGIDFLTWMLLRQSAPDITARLKVIDQTEPTPGLPYITAAHRNPAPLAAATRAAIMSLSPQDRQILQVRDLAAIPAATYLELPTP